jgi:hypothetical protein
MPHQVYQQRTQKAKIWWFDKRHLELYVLQLYEPSCNPSKESSGWDPHYSVEMPVMDHLPLPIEYDANNL